MCHRHPVPTLLRRHLHMYSNRPPRDLFAPVSSFLRPMGILRLYVPLSPLQHISTFMGARTRVRAPSHLARSFRLLPPLFSCRSLPKTLTLQSPTLYRFPLPRRYLNFPKAAALTFTPAPPHIPSHRRIPLNHRHPPRRPHTPVDTPASIRATSPFSSHVLARFPIARSPRMAHRNSSRTLTLLLQQVCRCPPRHRPFRDRKKGLEKASPLAGVLHQPTMGML